VWSTFLRTAGDEKYVVIAYCFMPDHLHVLVEGDVESDGLARFVAMAKQRTSLGVRGALCGRLWQPGHFDRALRSEDNVYDVAKYIIQNPVRGGLVRTVFDYPYWGSALLTPQQLVESTMWTPG
jgi:REP element-mobilizing transposase RayT